MPQRLLCCLSRQGVDQELELVDVREHRAFELGPFVFNRFDKVDPLAGRDHDKLLKRQQVRLQADPILVHVLGAVEVRHELFRARQHVFGLVDEDTHAAVHIAQVPPQRRVGEQGQGIGGRFHGIKSFLLVRA